MGEGEGEIIMRPCVQLACIVMKKVSSKDLALAWELPEVAHLQSGTSAINH